MFVFTPPKFLHLEKFLVSFLFHFSLIQYFYIIKQCALLQIPTFGEIKILIRLLQFPIITMYPPRIKNVKIFSKLRSRRQRLEHDAHTPSMNCTRPMREPGSKKTVHPFGFGDNESASHITAFHNLRGFSLGCHQIMEGMGGKIWKSEYG